MSRWLDIAGAAVALLGAAGAAARYLGMIPQALRAQPDARRGSPGRPRRAEKTFAEVRAREVRGGRRGDRDGG